MMKKIISLIMVLISLLSIVPLNAFAVKEVEAAEIIQLENGNYIKVTTETLAFARVANTVTGSKVYTCYGNYDNVVWKATLTATFAYSGAWYTCTNANCNVTIYNSHWQVFEKNTVATGSCAITNLTMRMVAEGQVQEVIDCEIRLNCDANGNIS